MPSRRSSSEPTAPSNSRSSRSCCAGPMAWTPAGSYARSRTRSADGSSTWRPSPTPIPASSCASSIPLSAPSSSASSSSENRARTSITRARPRRRRRRADSKSDRSVEHGGDVLDVDSLFHDSEIVIGDGDHNGLIRTHDRVPRHLTDRRYNQACNRENGGDNRTDYSGQEPERER